MSRAMEKLSMPRDEDGQNKKAPLEDINEITSDMVVVDDNDSFEVKEELEVAEKERERQRKKSMDALRRKLSTIAKKRKKEDVEYQIIEDDVRRALKEKTEARSADVKKSLDELREIEEQRVQEELLAKQKDKERKKARVSELRAKLKDLKKPKQESGVIPPPPGFVETKDAKSPEGSSSTEDFTPEEKAWFKAGEEAENVSAKNSEHFIPDSIEPYLEKIEEMHIPGFDSTTFAEMTRKHHKLEQELSDEESGALKIGWFKKRRMKRDLKKLTRMLEPMWQEIDHSVSAVVREKKLSKMSESERQDYLKLESFARNFGKRSSPNKRGASRAGNIKI